MDFIEQFFGSTGGRGMQGPGRRGGFGEAETGPEKGRDVEGDMMVTLEEAVRGSLRSVSVRHMAPCENCGGTGGQGRRASNRFGGGGAGGRAGDNPGKSSAGGRGGGKDGNLAGENSGGRRRRTTFARGRSRRSGRGGWRPW